MMTKILQTAFNQTSISYVKLLDGEQKTLAELGTSLANTTQTLDIPLTLESAEFVIVTAPIYYNYNSLDNIFQSDDGADNDTSGSNILGWVIVESSKAETNLSIWRYFFVLILCALVFIISMTLLSWRIAKHFAMPINKLDGALRHLISEDYDSAKTINLTKPYQHIQKSLVEIAGRMEGHSQELLSGIEQSTADIQRNMDSLEEKSAQLYIANKEAMESNRLKSQFLANMSHELRTPLNAIQGYTKILKQIESDAQKRLYLDTVDKSANNLLSIISDILDFSKIEAEKLTFVYSDFNLRELLDEVYQTLSANLFDNNKQLDLIPEIHPKVPEWLIGDTTRIRQVLTNLIGNAVKFTHQGHVKTQISVLHDDSESLQLSFKVIDTGIGIPSSKIKNLFKPFSQADSSTTRQFGGTGLGLVITKKLIEQMQGSIELTSTPNIGTTFHFTLQLQTSQKANTIIEGLDLTTLLFEPSNNYKLYLAKYLESINVSVKSHTKFEALINQLTSECDDIDALLIGSSSNELNSLTETKELIEYASQELKIPCILMLQSASQLALDDKLKSLASDVLLKPISHRRLYESLKKLTLTNQAITELSTQPKIQLSKLKVLVVDDTKINLELVKHWLVPHKIQVSLALSGHQAIEMATKETFDLIFMDIQMPDLNGMQTTQKIRAMAAYEAIPIIALTAHASGNEQRQILNSGMNSYLTKPVDEDTLLNTIEKWCSSSETIQQQVDTQIEEIFDLDRALEIVKGSTKMAKEMFEMLNGTLQEEHKLLQHFYQSEELDKLIQTVHKINGAAKYTGAVSLSKHAGFLETHLKELGFEEVEGVYQDFIEELERLMTHQQLIPWPQE
ncbi:ATP-binding protein [Marinomonas epiphytica]